MLQLWQEKELELQRRLTLLLQQTLEVKVQDWHRRDSWHQLQSSELNQKAQHEQPVPVTLALILLTAAAFECGGCQMRGTRPSRQSPPRQQPKRGQHRRAGCSLLAKALEAHEANGRAAMRAQRRRPCLSAPTQASTRRSAAHAVRRAAKQLLHVCNGATGRSLNNDRACAIAAGAPNRHLDRIGRNNGWYAAGGGGRRLHSTIAI